MAEVLTLARRPAEATAEAEIALGLYEQKGNQVMAEWMRSAGRTADADVIVCPSCECRSPLRDSNPGPPPYHLGADSCDGLPLAVDLAFLGGQLVAKWSTLARFRDVDPGVSYELGEFGAGRMA